MDHGPRLAKALLEMARGGISRPLDAFADHPLADEWHDFAHAAVCAHLDSRRGLVYVASNPVHVGLYKVGSTAGETTAARLKSLRTAGVVGEFHEIESFACLDRFGAERRAHRAMATQSQQHKEFFVTDHRTVTDVVRDCVASDNAALEKAFPWIGHVA